MATNILTARKIETSKPKDKEYLIGDGEGLYLRIRPNHQRDWFFIYTLNDEGIYVGHRPMTDDEIMYSHIFPALKIDLAKISEGMGGE